MGRGRVDLAPPAHINTVPKGRKKRRGKGRETERERPTVFEREGRDRKRETTVFVRGKGMKGGKQ
jgi:hypothetical protein